MCTTNLTEHLPIKQTACNGEEAMAEVEMKRSCDQTGAFRSQTFVSPQS